MKKLMMFAICLISGLAQADTPQLADNYFQIQKIRKSISKDGQKFAAFLNFKDVSKNASSLIGIIDLNSKKILQTFPFQTSPIIRSERYIDGGFVVFSDDDKYIFVADEGSAAIISIASGKVIRSFNPSCKSCDIHAPIISEDGNRLVFASTEHITEIYDLPTGKLIQKIEKKGRISDAIVSPDGSKLILESGESRYDLSWELFTQNSAGTYEEDGTFENFFSSISPYSNLRFSADSNRLLAWRYKDPIYLLDFKAHSYSPILTLEKSAEVISPVFSPDSQWLVVSVNRHIMAVDLTTLKIKYNYETDEQEANHHFNEQDKIQFSQDGKTFLCRTDNSISVYDLSSGLHKEVHKFDTLVQASFLPEASKILVVLQDDRSNSLQWSLVDLQPGN